MTGLLLHPDPADDTFTYRITDGTHEATGTVHLHPISIPTPPPYRIRAVPPLPGGGLTFAFNAPAAGTYALERKSLAAPGGVGGFWNEVSRQTATGPGLITFVDGRLPAGALYRVRTVP